MGLKLTSDSFKDSEKLTGTQYRLGNIGLVLDTAYRNIDAAFKKLEAEHDAATADIAAKIKTGTVTIADDANSATVDTTLGAGAVGKPFILTRTDSNNAGNATRFTGSISNAGVLTVQARNNAGNLTDPGDEDVVLSWVVDAR